MRTLAGLLAVTLTGCFGDLRTTALEEGVGRIRGRVAAPVDPITAWVAVPGTTRTASLAADGAFLVEQVPAGTHAVVAVSGRGRVARGEATVLGGRTTDVALTLEDAVHIDGRVHFEGFPSAIEGATFRVTGWPSAGAIAGGARTFVTGDLPSGCHDVEVRVPGHRTGATAACVQAGAAAVDVFLIAIDTDLNDPCYPCVQDVDCGSGRCVAETTGGWMGTVCAPACAAGCPDGFECREGVCRLVNPAGCLALDDWKRGRSCAADADCGALTAADGLCVGGVCSLACDTDDACPFDQACDAMERAQRACGPLPFQ